MAADVVARVDVPARGARLTSEVDGGRLPGSGSYGRAGAADPLIGELVAQLVEWDFAVVGQDPFGTKEFQLLGGQMLCGPTRRSDHPMPRQIQRIGAHDPADDARAGKLCDS